MAWRKRKKGGEKEGKLTKYFKAANESTPMQRGEDDHHSAASDDDDDDDAAMVSHDNSNTQSDAGPTHKTINDLGLVIRKSMTHNEVSRAVLALTLRPKVYFANRALQARQKLYVSKSSQ